MALAQSYGWFAVAVLVGVRAVTGVMVDAWHITGVLLLADAAALGMAVRSLPVPPTNDAIE